jgi:DNA repair exonuclease SbcCD nuclease subunit
MTKIALTNDTHWGARGDSMVFNNYFGKFYDQIFFPTIKQHGIDYIVHLGDIVDRRKNINFMSLHKMKKHFFDPIFENGYRLDVILGNHDVAFKNTNEINAMNELFSYVNNPKFRYFSRPEDVMIGETSIAYLPWICSGNYKESMDFIQNTKSQILFGHLELKGFEMYRGAINDHGFDAGIFSKFDLVCSGHFHHKSTIGNINYLGSPYEITWSDYNDPRGFHIFDTETRELTYIQNPLRLFYKIFYDDAKDTRKDILQSVDNQQLIEDAYVKVVIKSKTKPPLFDAFIAKIEQCKVSELQIVEDHLNLSSVDDSDIISEAEDTVTMLSKYVDLVGPDSIDDKEQVVKFLRQLYEEAIGLE